MKPRKIFGMWIACLAMISILAMSAVSNAHESDEGHFDQASAPRSVDGGILFTFVSKDAHKVYLAGDFNGWAANDNGKVSNPEFELQRGENGVWWKVMPLEAKEIHYKFAVANEKGEYSWQPDPLVKERDKDDNAVVDLAKISSPSHEESDDEDNPSNGPKAVEGGIRFSAEFPDAQKVYLVGDFNNWGNNENGKVSDTAFEMERGENGVWMKVVPLEREEIHYKFVVANEKGECAWYPDPAVTEKDKDENTVLDIRKVRSRKPRGAGTAVNAGSSGPMAVEGGVLFTFESPDAHKVYIAGDFNNWADNDNGKVAGAAFEMEKGEDGVWKKIVSLSPDEHHYKFVVANEKGECTWVPDPTVTDKDKDENSVLDVGKLGGTSASNK